MKKTKIVKVISTLVVATAVVSCVYSCASNSNNIENEEVLTSTGAAEQTTNVLESTADTSIVEPSTRAEATTSSKDDVVEEEPEETKMVGKVQQYIPLNFSEVSDLMAEYDKLIQKREEYNERMKKVVEAQVFFTNEEITAAVYNIVRIDSDLSSLIVKIYNNEMKAIKNEVYLADQIERLEAVQHDMEDLKIKIDASNKNYTKVFNRIEDVDVEQIERVYKYSYKPLEKPLQKIEDKIEDLKDELEAALAAQS